MAKDEKILSADEIKSISGGNVKTTLNGVDVINHISLCDACVPQNEDGSRGNFIKAGWSKGLW